MKNLLNKRFKSCLLLLSSMLLGVVFGGMAVAASQSVYIPDEYIIQVQPGSDLYSIQQQVDKMGSHVVSALPLSNTYLIKQGRAKGVKSISKAAASKLKKVVISKLQPNYRAKLMDVVTENPQWDLEMIGMKKAWPIATWAKPVIVAVNDSGVAKHPYLENILLDGIDVSESVTAGGTEEPNYNPSSHGTKVAGVIAAEPNIDKNMVGVCINNVEILPIKIFDRIQIDDTWYEYASTASILRGLDEALKFKKADGNRVGVVNMSYGGLHPGVSDDAQHQKMMELSRNGIVLVAASGNDAAPLSAPAMYDECIAVGAVDKDGAISSYSSYGPRFEVDIVAPGGDFLGNPADAQILSTSVLYDVPYSKDSPYLDYDYGIGTSFAAPLVSGAAALLLSQGVKPVNIREYLVKTAKLPVHDPVPPGGIAPNYTLEKIKYGAGVLDVFAALKYTMPSVPQPIQLYKNKKDRKGVPNNGWNIILNSETKSLGWVALQFTYHGVTKTYIDAKNAKWIIGNPYVYDASVSANRQLNATDLVPPKTEFLVRVLVGDETEKLTVKSIGKLERKSPL